MNITKGMIIREKKTDVRYMVAALDKDLIHIVDSEGNRAILHDKEINEEYELITYGLETEGKNREPYEAPKIEFISFDDIYRLTEKTLPIRSSEIQGTPDHLKGMMICPYCWEPLFNNKKKKYYNYCPGCGRKVAE